MAEPARLIIPTRVGRRFRERPRLSQLSLSLTPRLPLRFYVRCIGPANSRVRGVGVLLSLLRGTLREDFSLLCNDLCH